MSAVGDIFKCPQCRRIYRVMRANSSCAVLHEPGECCHYGEREVTVVFMDGREVALPAPPSPAPEETK